MVVGFELARLVGVVRAEVDPGARYPFGLFRKQGSVQQGVEVMVKIFRYLTPIRIDGKPGRLLL